MTTYVPPEWAANGSNRHGLSMEVIKGGIIVEKVALDTSSKSFLVAGRMEPLCDVVLQHPSVSRTHAALQFNDKGQLFVVDLGSTHGTFVNKKRLSTADHVELHVGDVVVFGESTRIYTILGPVDLMPEEYSSDNLAKLRSKLEARHQRRQLEKKTKDEDEGATWGFREDAVEESDSDHSDDDDTAAPNKAKPNVPLPDYLRNRQNDVAGPYVSSVTKDNVNLAKDSKLYTRLQNRIQKLENLNSESQRIRAKQNVGLTDGQEAALARNDKRTQELQDEIETLEAQLLAKHTQRTTQKEVAATAKSSAGKAKAPVYDSDDDDFYDRTKSKHAATTSTLKQKAKGAQVMTYESISATLTGLRADLKLLDAVKTTDAAPASGAPDSQEEVDSLDMYMLTSAQSLAAQDAAKAESDRARLLERIHEMEKLLEIATPAWAKLVAPVAPEIAAESTTEGAPSSSHPLHAAPPPTTDSQADAAMPVHSKDHVPSMTASSTDQQGEIAAAPAPYKSALDVSSFHMTYDEPDNGESEANEERPPKQPRHDQDVTGETAAPPPKRIRQRRKDVAKTSAAAKVFDDAVLEGGDVVWQPPTNQSGDGRTALNDKYGY